jgi:outer membrane protein assembly factor BamB
MKSYVWVSIVLLAPAIALGRSPFPNDWPQWQGPTRDAVSQERGLLKAWPKGGPPLAWKITGIGGGDSAPSIAAGGIFGMGNLEGNAVVWALDEKYGKQLWVTSIAKAFPQRRPQSKEGPACTPSIDGDRLYAIGMGGELVCLQVADGKILWQRSLTQDFGGKVPDWSYRESPLVDGEKLICTPGGPDATMVALDKMTGKTIWKSAVPGNPTAAYASVIAIDLQGQREYVQLTRSALIGVAASDGKFLWKYDHPASRSGINCSTPVYLDGSVFAASAYGTGGGLVRLTKEPTGEVKAEEVYFTKRMQNHHGGMIVVDGYLYGANGGNEKGWLLCLDFKTGKIMWDQRDSGQRKAPKGSILLADGLFYYRTEDTGTMLLIEPNPQKYIELGRFEQPDRTTKPAWAHPVIANGKLYVRDQDTLFCYDVKAKEVVKQ